MVQGAENRPCQHDPEHAAQAHHRRHRCDSPRHPRTRRWSRINPNATGKIPPPSPLQRTGQDHRPESRCQRHHPVRTASTNRSSRTRFSRTGRRAAAIGVATDAARRRRRTPRRSRSSSSRAPARWSGEGRHDEGLQQRVADRGEQEQASSSSAGGLGAGWDVAGLEPRFDRPSVIAPQRRSTGSRPPR